MDGFFCLFVAEDYAAFLRLNASANKPAPSRPRVPGSGTETPPTPSAPLAAIPLFARNVPTPVDVLIVIVCCPKVKPYSVEPLKFKPKTLLKPMLPIKLPAPVPGLRPISRSPPVADMNRLPLESNAMSPDEVNPVEPTLVAAPDPRLSVNKLVPPDPKSVPELSNVSPFMPNPVAPMAVAAAVVVLIDTSWVPDELTPYKTPLVGSNAMSNIVPLFPISVFVLVETSKSQRSPLLAPINTALAEPAIPTNAMKSKTIVDRLIIT